MKQATKQEFDELLDRAPFKTATEWPKVRSGKAYVIDLFFRDSVIIAKQDCCAGEITYWIVK